MTTIFDTHFTLDDTQGVLWRATPQYELQTRQEDGSWGEAEFVGTLDSYREANPDDDHLLMMLDLLEAGADEVIIPGGAAPTVRIQQVRARVTDAEIRRLEAEAAAAGDHAQAAICRRALGDLIDPRGILRGDEWGRVMNLTPPVARMVCDRAIRLAQPDTL